LALVAGIDALERSNMTVFGPEIPEEVWTGMHRRGQMRTRLRSIGDPLQADLVVLGARGDPGVREVTWQRRQLARVHRGGVVLLDAYAKP
jgi:hypothetical protein